MKNLRFVATLPLAWGLMACGPTPPPARPAELTVEAELGQAVKEASADLSLLFDDLHTLSPTSKAKPE